MATPKPHAPGELDEELERDEENDSAEMRDLLRKVAAAPSIDPSTLSSLPPSAIQGFEPGEKLGHFRILERIGAGGMGVVYRAEDERLRRKVALKVLPPHQVFDRERRKRLWREAQSAAAVNHPNIAAIYELGEAEGAVFIAMEFLDGQPLRRYLSRKPLPLSEVLAVATQIAQGLARAHDAGIVHRDLKPDNVMVLPDRTVKILDFGLAKLLAAPEERLPPTPTSGSGSGTGSTATKDGQVVGTPKYMSPEQKRGADVDARSDLYSFGVLLAELLCGKWPEPADRNLVGIFRAALAHHGSMDLEQRTLLEQLAGVAAHCLAEDPVDRFPTALDLLASLRTVALVSGAGTARGRAHRVSGGWVLAVSVAVALAIAAGIWWERRPSQAQPASATAQRMTERRLTANPPDNPVLDAALSPDGKTLAYVDRAGLFLRGLDPVWTEQVRLSERGPLQSVAWFADGAELLVTIGKGGDEGTQLWRVRRDGTAKRIDAGYYERPRLSSTGRLAWIEPKGIAIGSVDAPRAQARVVVKLGPGEEVDQLTWSPDGTRIAFVRIVRAASSGLTARIETLSASGGGTQLVLESSRLIQESGDAAMTWAADGRILYALAEVPPRETGFTLWSVPIEPSTGRPLQPPQPLHAWTGSTPGLLTTSRDGAIAYARTETQSDVYIAELADGGRRLSSPRRLTMTDHNERPAAWTPDSKSVLLTSDQNGSSDLFAQDVGSGLLRPVLGTRNEETWPTQLPDGQLLFWQHPHADGEQGPHPAELRRAELGATASTPVLTTTFACDHTGADLPPHNARYRCPARGPCLLGELDGTEWIFSEFQPANGARQERLRVKNPGRGAVGWDLSRDGTKLAIPGAIGQVKIVDVATGKSVDRFVDQGCSLEHAAWAPDGNGLFVTGVCVGDRPFKLYFTELYRSAQLLWDSSSKWFGLPIVSPDGRQLAFAVRPYDNDVWLARGL